VLSKREYVYCALIPTSMSLQHPDTFNLDRNPTEIQGTNFLPILFHLEDLIWCICWHAVPYSHGWKNLPFSVIVQKWGIHLDLILFQFLSQDIGSG